MFTAIINVRNHDVDVDIERELRAYDWGYNARWTSDKLIASSPFRHDRTPSFFVNLDGEYAGYWGDSGAIIDEYARGDFAALVALLRSITREQAEDYLLGEYGRHLASDGDSLIRLPSRPRLRPAPPQPIALPEDIVTHATSPYLLSRGISAETQERYGIGYNERYKGFTAIPWKLADGRIGNVKYRSTRDKRFFYERGATPINAMVYGLDVVDEGYAVICEGEIDALSFAEAGIPAIALGGAQLSRAQAQLLCRSGVRTIYLGGDNDDKGRALNRQVRRGLGDYVRLCEIEYSDVGGQEKDANDVLLRHGVEGLRVLIESAREVQRINLRQLSR